MKKLSLAIALLLGIGTSYAQSVKFSSDKPEAGKPLSFEYNAAGGKLEKLTDVKCVVQTFVNTKQKTINIPLEKNGTTYKGSFTPVDSTAIAVLVFTADQTKDENPNGYYTLFYSKGKPTAMAYYWESVYYNGMGTAYSGIKADKPRAIVALDNAFKTDPTLRPKYLVNYLGLHFGVDRDKAEPMIDKEIVLIEKMKAPKEADLTRMAGLYSVSKRKPKADSVYAMIKKTFPTGTYAYGLAVNEIYAEKDAVQKEAKLNALITNFKLDLSKKGDLAKVSNIYGNVATAFGAAKNNAKFEEYANKVEAKMNRASLYNTFAWAAAEKKDNLEFAAEISKKSLALLEDAKGETAPDYYASKEDYVKALDRSLAMYIDTYATLLGHLGKNEEALKLQEVAVAKNEYSDASMNAKYVNLLALNKQFDKVTSFGERFVKEGQGTDQMKADLKLAYKGTQPFDAHYAELEREALAKEKAKFIKEMINTPAPKFTLANLQGENVSLESLKGKVVIVDYWATWCGPCIASFPGMQKAVDKYKTDPNVVFLFVNTWQTEANRDKVVRDYLATTPYTFNVLFDTPNKQDPSKFDVIEQYKVEGIPTKFILDGKGNIRFKKVGFGGSADGTVKELDMMIALAKDGQEASK
ncbi:MAG: TlpA family protein disulfide reductase [Flavobacterium sp.]|nr:MAG: TlpA family protein disulfide reductase [Flavobacterium sp.]